MFWLKRSFFELRFLETIWLTELFSFYSFILSLFFFFIWILDIFLSRIFIFFFGFLTTQWLLFAFIAFFRSFFFYSFIFLDFALFLFINIFRKLFICFFYYFLHQFVDHNFIYNAFIFGLRRYITIILAFIQISTKIIDFVQDFVYFLVKINLQFFSFFISF